MSDTKISEFPEKALSSLDAAGTADFVGGYDVISNNKSNKKFTFSTLANWLLTKFKLTIAGSSQTVKAAIDSLNSNGLYDRGRLITNADLNTFKTPGLYYCSYADGLNFPTGLSFSAALVEVSLFANGGGVCQVCIDAVGSSKRIWRRYFVNNAWTAWVKQPERGEIDALNSKVAVPSKLLTKEATTTATIHLPSNGRFVIFEMCNGSNSLYAMLVTVYANGTAYKLDLAKGGDVYAELSTNTLTITSGPNVSFRILVMSLEPSISMDDITIS